MRSRQEKLLSSKPEPPDDLWDKLDAALEESKVSKRPDDSFTRAEYQARHDISDSTARRRIQKLGEIGKIRKHGKGAFTYYVWVG